MIENSLAETKWCPFALVQSEEKLCGVSGDALGGFSGNNVAVTVINRTANGEKHPDCLCITDRCVWWRTHNGTKGDCSKLNDNITLWLMSLTMLWRNFIARMQGQKMRQ